MDYSIDKYGMRKEIQQFSSMAKEGLKLGQGINLVNTGRVFVCGMGGSGLPGMIANALNHEIITIKDYHIPDLKKEDTAILISYSGNTEETISCHRDALRVGCETVIISTGGRLAENKSKDAHFIELPKGHQPRAALPYMFFALLALLKENNRLSINSNLSLNTASIEVSARKLAETIGDKTIIIYSTPRLFPAAYRWKTQLNENAKQHAFCNVFSELCHNELEAWNNKEDYHVVFMTETKEYSRMQKRIDLVKKSVKRVGATVSYLSLKGDYLQALFQAIILGDFLSYYQALNKGIDPTPVNVIEDFKKEMGPYI